MAQLIVRNVDEEVVKALKLRAAQKGVSTESEHRDILRSVLLRGPERPPFKSVLASMPDFGQDDDFLSERDSDRKNGLFT
jgi:plasmid stability protein